MTRVPVFLRRLQPTIGRALRVMTRFVGPITRALSPALGTAGVPRYAHCSTFDYVTAHPEVGAAIEVVRPAEAIARTVPAGIPPRHWRFTSQVEVTVPEAFVASIRGGRVISDLGAVVAPPGVLLSDLSPYFSVRGTFDHPVFRRIRLPNVEVLDGALGVLSVRGDDNYFHFVLDVLPRIDLLNRSRFGGGIERFLVRRRSRFQHELLDLCGLPDARTIDSGSHPHVEAGPLVVPSFRTFNAQTPAWVVSFLRSSLLRHARWDGRDGPPRRFYVTRGGGRRSRSVVDEDAVLDALRTRGVQPVALEKLSVREQIALFRSAELIVAPHGAGLTNLVFCESSVKVVEILHPGYMNVCFWKLGSLIEGLEYRYVVGQGERPSPAHDLDAISADIAVDIRTLTSTLDEIAGSR